MRITILTTRKGRPSNPSSNIASNFGYVPSELIKRGAKRFINSFTQKRKQEVIENQMAKLAK